MKQLMVLLSIVAISTTIQAQDKVINLVFEGTGISIDSVAASKEYVDERDTVIRYVIADTAAAIRSAISNLTFDDDQALSLSSNTLTLEDGGTVDLSGYLDNTDNQTLSLSGDILTLEDGGTVDISSYNESQVIIDTAAAIRTAISTVSKWAESGNDIYNLNSGNLGIGTSSPDANLHIKSNVNNQNGLIVEDISGSSSGIATIKLKGRRDDGNTSGAFAGQLVLSRTDNDNAGDSESYVDNNTRLGRILFGGNHTDGNDANLLYTSSIIGRADESYVNSTSMKGKITFGTTSSGTSGISESAANTHLPIRMQIAENNIVFSDYGGGNITGTETYLLGVESDGDIIEVPIFNPTAQISDSTADVRADLIAYTDSEIADTDADLRTYTDDEILDAQKSSFGYVIADMNTEVDTGDYGYITIGHENVGLTPISLHCEGDSGAGTLTVKLIIEGSTIHTQTGVDATGGTYTITGASAITASSKAYYEVSALSGTLTGLSCTTNTSY